MAQTNPALGGGTFLLPKSCHSNPQLLFHLVSSTPDTCRATESGAALQAGMTESPSPFHFSFSLKGRCFKKTRAFHNLLNMEPRLPCSPCLPRLLGASLEDLPRGDHTAACAIFTHVQTDTWLPRVRAERNLYNHLPDLCPERQETQRVSDLAGVQR